MADELDKMQADELAGTLLHSFSRSLLSQRYDDFRSCFHLPCLIEVSGTTRIAVSEGELERTYGAIRSYFEANDVSDVVSTIVSVDVLTPDSLGLTGVLCLMKTANVRLNSPFPVYFVVNQSNDSWRISCSVYAIVNAPGLSAALREK